MAGVEEECETRVTVSREDTAKKERKKASLNNCVTDKRSCDNPYVGLGMSPAMHTHSMLLSHLQNVNRSQAACSSGSQELCFLLFGFLIGKRSRWSFEGKGWLSHLGLLQFPCNTFGSKSKGSTDYAEGSQTTSLTFYSVKEKGSATSRIPQ